MPGTRISTDVAMIWNKQFGTLFFHHSYKERRNSLKEAYRLIRYCVDNDGNAFYSQITNKRTKTDEIYVWSYCKGAESNQIRIYYIEDGKSYCIIEDYAGSLEWLNEIDYSGWIKGGFPDLEGEEIENYDSKFFNRKKADNRFWIPDLRILDTDWPECVKQYTRDYFWYVEPFIKMKKVIATDETLQTVERK